MTITGTTTCFVFACSREQIASWRTHEDREGGIILTCRKGKDCVRTETDGPMLDPNSDKEYRLQVCDAETASHVKAAIDALIALNKSSH